MGVNANLVKPLRMGNVTVAFPVLLAPMAGYTDAVMRSIAGQYRCGMAFTEVANAEGIVRGAQQTFHFLETAPDEAPVAAHIYGAHPDTLARAAAVIEQTGRFQAIDLNCGCPVARIVAKGAGAALMKQPEKIARIVRAMKQAVTLPITVKTRLGLAPERQNISEIAHAVEESGASALTIHARPVAGRHTGQTDWAALARIKSERSIPVIGNGGVISAPAAARMFAETGVDGVMIGQAAIGNPWIFTEAWALLHAQPAPLPSAQERRAVIEQHLRRLIAHLAQARPTIHRPRLNAEQKAVLHFRGHLLGYIRGLKKSVEIRRQLQGLRRVSDVMTAVDSLLAGEGLG